MWYLFKFNLTFRRDHNRYQSGLRNTSGWLSLTIDHGAPEAWHGLRVVQRRGEAHRRHEQTAAIDAGRQHQGLVRVVLTHGIPGNTRGWPTEDIGLLLPYTYIYNSTNYWVAQDSQQSCYESTDLSFDTSIHPNPNTWPIYFWLQHRCGETPIFDAGVPTK